MLVTDIDDLPYAAVRYPGLDVHLADLADVIDFDLDLDTCTGLMGHPEYGPRMREHARSTESGPAGLEFHDLDRGGEA